MGRKRPCALSVQSRVNRVLAGHRESSTRYEKDQRAIPSSSVRQQCVSADLFICKDTTWTTRTCFPIPTHRNMSLRAKPPENRSKTRRFRTGPTPTLPSVQRDDRERLCELDRQPAHGVFTKGAKRPRCSATEGRISRGVAPLAFVAWSSACVGASSAGGSSGSFASRFRAQPCGSRIRHKDGKNRSAILMGYAPVG
jgi:hypothetical protein